jgi:hypothetical protein
MKALSVTEIKQELQHLPKEKLVALCLRLAKFKKENKELLTFLLFEANDIPAYIASIKAEIQTQFDAINFNSVYFIKKSLRKILRMCAKYIRYSGDAVVEIEILLHFCHFINNMDGAAKNNNIIVNIYNAQVKKINAAIASLHPDLQYEYVKALQELE